MAEASAALARIGKEDLPCTREEGANRASDLQSEEDVNMANMANLPLAGRWRLRLDMPRSSTASTRNLCLYEPNRREQVSCASRNVKRQTR